MSMDGRQFLNALWGRRGGVAAASYARDLVDDYGADEVWPLVDIASGTTIHAFVNSNRDGTLTGWDLQDAAGPVSGTDAPYSDGVNDEGDIYSSNGVDGLNDVFNGDVYSVFVWMDTTAWLDGDARGLFIIATGDGRIELNKTARVSLPARMEFRHWNSGTNVTVSHNADPAPTGWHSYGQSVDINAGADGEMKAFFDGSQTGSTQTGFGTLSGPIQENFTKVGNGAADITNGHIAYCAIMFGSIWTPTQFANMHAAAATAGAD